MKKKYNKFYRLNYQIRAPQMRLLDDQGKQIGVLSKDEALKLARSEQKDLVEIAPKAKPPVVKLIDFKKFKYLEAKKERESKKKAKNVGVKVIRLSPYMAENDFNIRVKKGEEFLKEGNQLKIALPFKGRQIVHKEFGFETINKAIKMLEPVSKVVKSPYFEGRVLVAMLSAEVKKNVKSKDKTEN